MSNLAVSLALLLAPVLQDCKDRKLKITLKLFATLGKYLPASERANEIDLEIADDATPNDVIEQFGVPHDMVHLVLLNGVYVEPAKRSEPVMRAGDALAIWPPVAGG